MAARTAACRFHTDIRPSLEADERNAWKLPAASTVDSASGSPSPPPSTPPFRTTVYDFGIANALILLVCAPSSSTTMNGRPDAPKSGTRHALITPSSVPVTIASSAFPKQKLVTLLECSNTVNAFPLPSPPTRNTLTVLPDRSAYIVPEGENATCSASASILL